jgi:carboxyl-terminal processing protease
MSLFKKYIIFILLINISNLTISQDIELRSTNVKVQRLLYLIEQMYVEDVNTNKLQEDLVLGMYNYLRPMSLYQHDSIFRQFNLESSEKTSLGFTIKFNKGKILIDSIFSKSGAENFELKKGDQIIGIDNNRLNEVYYYSDFFNLSIGDENSISNVNLIREKDTLNIYVRRLKIPNHSIIPIPNAMKAHSISSYENGLKLFNLIYPDTITKSEITEHGIRYMLEQLDPHSTYISLKDLHDMNAPLKGSFTGVGIRFQIFKDTILIVQAIPGGPSEKVGLMAGDKIIKIGEEMVAGIGMKNSGVRDRLLGDKGTNILVGVQRGNSKEVIDFKITRDKIPIYSVDASYMADENTGYIKLNNFSSTSLSEIRKAVFSLKEKGMKNLILDLQNNGGGYLKTAVDLADEMLPGNRRIVSTKGRKFPEKIYGGNNTGLLENGKIIVLVNESSASASEIVSGAIQDWDRGLIVGRRTFGKGLVQKPIQLPDGSQVRITTSKYYTPSGRCIQKPYGSGSMAYRKEKYSRYKSGESFNKDSIKNNENEAYSTILKKRKVYGGGGIVPDIFVALDTNGTSAYFSKLVRKGVFNQFSLYYVNKYRKNLENKYPNFKDYKLNFKTEKPLQELINFANEDGIEFNEKQFNDSKKTIEVRLKANIAQDLFDYKKFYEIINELNVTLQKSIEIIKNDGAFFNLAQ